MSFCWPTVKKVLAWRVVSIATASIVAWPMMDNYVHSLTVTVVINPIMLAVHYAFEKCWSARHGD